MPELAERFPRRVRLTKRSEFDTALARGFRVHGTFLVVHVLPNELAHARLGLTVSRRLGNAAVRNRTKRRLRELFRRELRPRLDRDLRPADVVVRALPPAASADLAALRDELDRALSRWAAAGFGGRGSRRGRRDA